MPVPPATPTLDILFKDAVRCCALFRARACCDVHAALLRAGAEAKWSSAAPNDGQLQLQVPSERGEAGAADGVQRLPLQRRCIQQQVQYHGDLRQ